MTNGEKIKELFPHFDVEDKTEYFGRLRNLDDHFIKADIDFWNAEYKKPTTKIDCEHTDCNNCVNHKYCDYESTTKNDLPHCQHTDEEIAKSFIEDVEAVKDQLPTTKNNLGVDWESYKDVDGNCLDDLILEVLQNNFDCGNTYGYKVADEIIGLLPSVTPQESKTGHWIGHREHCENLGAIPSGLGAYEWCSNCDCGIDISEWHRNHYNYCPNCGCHMVEPQEREDT